MKRTFEIDLLVGGYSYTVTDDLKNWDDVKFSFERSDYGGVIKSFSTKFEFCGTSYTALRNEYLANYLSSSANIVVYSINNSRLRSERFRCALDFSTMEDDGATISINAIDNTLASIIKSKKSTTYDILVADIKEEKQLSYDGLTMSNYVNWVTGGTVNDAGDEYLIEVQAGTNYSFPLYITKSEIAIKNVYEPIDSPWKSFSGGIPGNDSYFFKTQIAQTINLNIQFKAKAAYTMAGAMQVVLYKNKSLADGNKFAEWQIYNGNKSNIHYSGEITLAKGDALYMAITSQSTVYNPIIISEFEYIKMDWNARMQEPALIDIVKPLSLLSSIIQNIYGSEVECSIPLSTRLLNTGICAAESLRGLANAKIHTSYSKFSEFMEAEYGYVPIIESNKVSFVHRDTLFVNEVVKSLGGNLTDFKFNVDDSMIYQSVKVGYDKQDYDSVNGRDEFRFTNEFTTGINLTDNTLELISPYRADAYGIEFLVEKRGEDTTDDNSDNDVFIIGVIQDLDKYYLDRTYSISGVISPNTMFNALFSPKAMLEANKAYIGSFASLLTFASAEGNSDVTIGGVSEKDNMPITDRLFRAEKVSISTPDTDPPSTLTKAVDFIKNGKTYRGFIMSADYMIGKPEAVTYNLLVQGIYENS